MRQSKRAARAKKKARAYNLERANRKTTTKRKFDIEKIREEFTHYMAAYVMQNLTRVGMKNVKCELARQWLFIFTQDYPKISQRKKDMAAEVFNDIASKLDDSGDTLADCLEIYRRHKLGLMTAKENGGRSHCNTCGDDFEDDIAPEMECDGCGSKLTPDDLIGEDEDYAWCI